jgi:hypothetical protein
MIKELENIFRIVEHDGDRRNGRRVAPGSSGWRSGEI